jgi:hypothetical protein
MYVAVDGEVRAAARNRGVATRRSGPAASARATDELPSRTPFRRRSSGASGDGETRAGGPAGASQCLSIKRKARRSAAQAPGFPVDHRLFTRRKGCRRGTTVGPVLSYLLDEVKLERNRASRHRPRARRDPQPGAGDDPGQVGARRAARLPDQPRCPLRPRRDPRHDASRTAGCKRRAPQCPLASSSTRAYGLPHGRCAGQAHWPRNS